MRWRWMKGRCEDQLPIECGLGWGGSAFITTEWGGERHLLKQGCRWHPAHCLSPPFLLLSLLTTLEPCSSPFLSPQGTLMLAGSWCLLLPFASNGVLPHCLKTRPSSPHSYTLLIFLFHFTP